VGLVQVLLPQAAAAHYPAILWGEDWFLLLLARLLHEGAGVAVDRGRARAVVWDRECVR